MTSGYNKYVDKNTCQIKSRGYNYYNKLYVVSNEFIRHIAWLSHTNRQLRLGIVCDDGLSVC